VSTCGNLSTISLTQNGETALYYAAKAGQSQVAEFLIDNEANVNDLNKVRTIW